MAPGATPNCAERPPDAEPEWLRWVGGFHERHKDGGLPVGIFVARWPGTSIIYRGNANAFPKLANASATRRAARSRASRGKGVGGESPKRDNASGMVLYSEGMCPTLYFQPKRSRLHAISRATASMTPRPFRSRAFCMAPVLSPTTARTSVWKRCPQATRQSSKETIFQNDWHWLLPVETPKAAASQSCWAFAVGGASQHSSLRSN